jgi:pimeloyl-ACP methyl ester carboxylesterase
MATVTDIHLRHGYADLPEVRLHYVEAGPVDGPLVVLLHGYPDFWYSWRHQIPALAAAGLRVVAPDMRGYNLSSKPAGVSAYAPRRMLQALRRPGRQLAKSWYMFFFQLPWLPERAVRAGDWRGLRYGFEHDARPGAFTPQDIDRYREAWSQPGAATATINYYRASMRRPPGREGRGLTPITAPTLVIWGERDRYLSSALAEPDRADVPNLKGVVRLRGASHWVQHDEPDRVSELLIEFFKG